MKKLSTLICILYLLIPMINSQGQDHGFGFGIMLGEPTGLSAKYWVSSDKAVDFGLAYSFLKSSNNISIHADYVQHLFKLIHSEYELPVYYGFGARLRASSNSKGMLGARGVVGVLLFNRYIPLDVFLEIAPIFNLFPETSLYFDIALGARYYF